MPSAAETTLSAVGTFVRKHIAGLRSVLDVVRDHFLLTPSLPPSLTHSLARSFTHPPTPIPTHQHTPVHSPIYSPTHPRTHSPTHALTHARTQVTHLQLTWTPSAPSCADSSAYMLLGGSSAPPALPAPPTPDAGSSR